MIRTNILLYILFSALCSFGQNEEFPDTLVPAELRKVTQTDWQQQVNYDIQVALDDQLFFLNGEIKIEYINNSPDDLSEIWFHLWPNAYKNDETPFAKQQIINNKSAFYYSNEEQRGYIDSLNFTVDGEPVNWREGNSIDVGYIQLKRPLKPGEYCIIRTPFRVKIPQAYSRLGHEGQSFQITQWYPKPAVYDVNGWNPIPYLDQGEFYSEFGKFVVGINVPDSYVVATSGKPINSIYKNGRKELVFAENNIHDFAWFADKKYAIDSQTVVLNSGKKVQCYMYFKGAKNNGLNALVKAVKFRSEVLDEYPYSHIAAVASTIKAGAGMEYPCITVVNNADELTIEHEVGHNWFYGILATYEREYAWMDEGLNSYYDLRYAEKQKQGPAKKSFPNLLGFDYTNEEFEHRLLYTFQAADHEEQPINLPSSEFTNLNYGAIVYSKAALSFCYLEHYLGRSLFDSAMNIYYQTWRFKHPLPGDLRRVLETVSGKNLSWFFDQLIKTNRRIDYKILGIYQDKNKPNIWMVDIANTGDIIAPLFIGCLTKNKVDKEYIQEGFWGTKTFEIPDLGCDKMMIDPYGISLEINRKDNIIKTRGLFKRLEPIKLKPLFSFGNPFKNEINYVPALGINTSDGVLLGIGLYNESVFTKRNSFALFPMYGVKSQTISGFASFSKKIFFNDELTQYILLKGEFRKFQLPDSAYTKQSYHNHYTRFAPEIEIVINKKTALSPIDNRFNLKLIHIEQFSNNNYTGKNNFFNLSFIHTNERMINAYKGTTTVQLHQSFQRIYTEWKGGINLNKPNKKLGYRFFAGYMYYNKLQNPDGINPVYSYKPEGNTGYWDYTYDQLLFDRTQPALRNNGFKQRQITERDGAFKTPFNFGQISDTWLIAANLRYPFPGKIPLELYADFCFYNGVSIDGATRERTNTPTFRYTSGLAVIIIKDVCEVYFPLLMSASMRDAIFYQDAKYTSKVSWLLQIDQLNIFKHKHKIISRAISQ